jgi:hypothetical protein
MRIIIPMLGAMLLLFLAGCDQTRTDAPPPTATTSAAQEDLIQKQANAVAASKVAAAQASSAAAEKRAADAEEKAAKTVAQKAQADADMAKASADLSAANVATAKAQGDAQGSKQALVTQHQVELQGGFDHYLYALILIGVGAGLMLWEGNYKFASILGVIGGSLIVTIFSLDFAVAHEGLIIGAALTGGAGFVVWHYKAKEIAAIAALVHWFQGKNFAEAEHAVQQALVTAYAKFKGWAVNAWNYAEAALHLKASTPAPVTPPAPPVTAVEVKRILTQG